MRWYYAMLMLFAIMGSAWAGGSSSRSAADKHRGSSNKILPRVIPHEDNHYLLEFHFDKNDHCEQMEPVLKRLEDELRTKVLRINIQQRREFQSLLENIGHDECGNVPFYYNRRTGQAICGATSYTNLKRWGTGDLKHLFQDPPENIFEQDTDANVKRGVGFQGYFEDTMNGLRGRGKKDLKKKSGNRFSFFKKSRKSNKETEPKK